MESVTSLGDSNPQSQIQDIHSYLATLQKDIVDGSGSTIVSLPSSEQLFAQSTDSTLTSQLLNGADNVQSFIHVTQEGDGGLNPTIQTIDQGATVMQTAQAPQIQPSIVLPQMIFTNSTGSTQPQFIQGLPTAQGITTLVTGEASSEANPHVIVETQPQPQTALLSGQVGEESGETADDSSSVVLNTGNSYQTVTIVPTSEVTQSGEVSYVLIVSQPEGGEEKSVTPGGSGDLSVFDFKEERGLPATGVEGGDVAETEGEPGEELGTGATKKGVVKYTVGGRTRTVTQLMCNYCNYTSPKRYLLTRHMKTHSEERPHKCSICDRGFKTVASLQNHINTHTGVKPHKCKECNATFTTSGELVRHVRYRHTYEKPHKCPDCDYASVELSKLKRHIRSHTGERPYQCPHCSYASPDTYKLKRHLRIHTGEKPYECDICHARFTQSNSLKAHKMIHTGEKPVFQCELCPTTCGRKTDLKIHVQKLHTSESPIQCKKCGKAFPDRYTYKIHMKTHDGEKCFRCELCPYAAMTQRHLESHILTHTGEKPFKCDECDMSFRQKQLLRRHKNLYHTPNYQPPRPKEKRHECVQCGKGFAHKGNMLRHMAIHDPDNPMYQEYNILKMEEEEEEEIEEEDEEDDSLEHLHQPSTTDYQPTQVQVQLVNEAGEHTGQIYLQLENPEAALQEGESVQMAGGVGGVEQEVYPSDSHIHPQVIKVEQLNASTVSAPQETYTEELHEVVQSQL